MHFDFTITLQGLITMAAVIGGFIRIERKLMWFLVEHEVLINDWQRRNPKEKLPTRSSRWARSS